MITSALVFAIVNGSSRPDSSGITRKVLGQIKALEDLGLSVFYIQRTDDGYWLATGNTRIRRVCPSPESYNYRIKNEIAEELCGFYAGNEVPDLLYIRGTRLFRSCRKLIRLFAKHKKKAVVEIPTVVTLRSRIDSRRYRELAVETLDTVCTRLISKRLEGFVVMSRDEKLYGNKTIRISNGIDTSAVSVLAPVPHEGIRLVAVALMQIHHGYERIIEGMHRYYTSSGDPERVYLDLVGEGPQTGYYRELTAKYGLQDYVVFHGVLQGKELDEVYNAADLGLGSFGMYKIGLENGSVLKLKEYCAKGLPFIYGCPEDTLSPSLDFCRLFANDSSPVDMEEVVSFYRKLRPRLEQVRAEMRSFAETDLSWKKEMGRVLEEVNG